MILFLCTVSPASADTISVPANYPTIQQAIDNANVSDTIEVSSGTYNENIVVNKRLTLSGTGTPVIDGQLKFDINTVTLAANGINFTGITVTGGGSSAAGIEITANDVEVRDCYVHDNEENGIELSSVTGTVIQDNNISNNPDGTGIFLNTANENFILNNTLKNNNDYGLQLHASSSNIIEKNNVQTSGLNGMHIEEASNLNVFSENTIEGSVDGAGIWLTYSDSNVFQENVVKNNGPSYNEYGGIIVITVTNTTFENNNVSRNNAYGIGCWDCENSKFLNNTISNNPTLPGFKESGLYLDSSGGNTITNNTISDNGYRGLFLKNSRYNDLSENNIL